MWVFAVFLWVVIYSDIPCSSKLSLLFLRELNQSIMCSHFLTVILTVWVYMVCLKFKMTLFLSRCWKIFFQSCTCQSTALQEYENTSYWKSPSAYFDCTSYPLYVSFIAVVWVWENVIYPPCPLKLCSSLLSLSGKTKTDMNYISR